MTIETAQLPGAPERTSARVTRIATVLISSAIPLLGVLYFGWSAINVLILYWLESLLVAVFTCARISEHWRTTRRRGHCRAGQLSSSPGEVGKRPALLRDYALIAFVFTLAHGLFVVVIAFILTSKYADSPMWRFQFTAFRQGALILAASLAIDFCVDRIGLAARPFAWIRAYTQQRMGRVLVLHLAIIFGMFAMAATSSPFGVLYALIALKTLWDLAMARGGNVAVASAAAPPAWLVKFGVRVGKGKIDADDMARQWKLDVTAAARRDIEDELPMPRR